MRPKEIVYLNYNKKKLNNKQEPELCGNTRTSWKIYNQGQCCSVIYKWCMSSNCNIQDENGFL